MSDKKDKRGEYAFVGCMFIGAKIPLNSEISLIGNYYLSFADLYEDIDIQNRSIQFYLSYGL